MRHHRTESDRYKTDRGGVVLLVVMVCLLIVTMAGGSAVKTALTQRRQMQREQFRRQADLLAASAIDRAAANLRTNPDYSDETWNVSADAVGAGYPASIDIQVKQLEDRRQRRVVSVVVDYPAGNDRRARVSRTLFVDLPDASE